MCFWGLLRLLSWEISRQFQDNVMAHFASRREIGVKFSMKTTSDCVTRERRSTGWSRAAPPPRPSGQWSRLWSQHILPRRGMVPYNELPHNLSSFFPRKNQKTGVRRARSARAQLLTPPRPTVRASRAAHPLLCILPEILKG